MIKIENPEEVSLNQYMTGSEMNGGERDMPKVIDTDREISEEAAVD